jgi:hypothetical protein
MELHRSTELSVHFSKLAEFRMVNGLSVGVSSSPLFGLPGAYPSQTRWQPAVYLILDTFIASVLGPHRLKKTGRGRETTSDSANSVGITGVRMPLLAVTCLIWPEMGLVRTAHRLAGCWALWGWKWWWRVAVACHFIKIVIRE